jgi:hypothetical protein
MDNFSMTKEHSLDYYRLVFTNFSIILRVFHRDLNFGHTSIFVERTKLNIRWTIRKKGHKKFIHDIPITFDSLIEFKDSSNIYDVAEALVAEALRMVPKELIIITTNKC